MLSEFDGYTWSRGGAQFFFLPPVRHEGAPVDYTVTLEPTGQHMLFVLDMVQSWTPRLASQGWDFGLRTRAPIHAVLQYQARSYPRYRLARPVEDFVFGIGIFTPEDVCVHGSNTDIDGLFPGRFDAPARVRVTIERCDLAPGSYLLDVAVHGRRGTPFDYWRAPKSRRKTP